MGMEQEVYGMGNERITASNNDQISGILGTLWCAESFDVLQEIPRKATRTDLYGE